IQSCSHPLETTTLLRHFRLSDTPIAFLDITRFRFRVKVQSCDRCSFGLLFAGYVSSWLSPMSISMRDYLPLSRQVSPRCDKLFLSFAGRSQRRPDQRTKPVVRFIWGKAGSALHPPIQDKRERRGDVLDKKIRR